MCVYMSRHDQRPIHKPTNVRARQTSDLYSYTPLCVVVFLIYLNFIDKSIDNSNSYLPGKGKNNFKLKANIDFKTSYTI